MTAMPTAQNIKQDLKPRPEGTDGSAQAYFQSVEEVDLRELGRKLWRRKGVILGTVVVLTVLALLIILQITPRYTASGHVMIDTRQSQVVDVEAVLSGLSADTETIQSEIQVIQSRTLAAKTIVQLQLDKDPEFNAALRAPTTFEMLRDPATYIPKEWLAVILGPPGDANLTDAEKADRERARVIDDFLDLLDVSPEGRSRVIRIDFESENPRTAAKVANALADFYIVAQLEAKFEATQRANLWLSDRLTELREKVEISESAVENFRKKSGLVRRDEKGSLVSQEVSQLSTQLLLERTSRAEAEARLRQVEDLMASSGSSESVSEVLQSSLIQRLREQEAEVERKAAELSVEYGERHPKIINVRAEIRDLRAKIKGEVSKIVQGLRNEVAVARAREASLKSALVQLKNEVGRQNSAEVQLRALEREAAANRTLFETFLGRSKETGEQESFQQADATILSRADAPEKASFPKKDILLLLSFVGSIFIGILLAFAIEMLDHGFRSMEQIEQMLGMAPLGLIPALKGLTSIGKAPEKYILEKPISAYAESIRSLHTSLLLSNVDKPPKVILIASSLPKEGKTSITLSLAHLLASSGQKVVIVDCDLRRPGAHESFGVPVSPGLVECLSGEVSLQEALYKDPVSGAYLLPAGRPAPSPPDLLGSDHMKKLLKALADGFDSVVIDSAPVLAVSDTLVLSRLVDKTVFLIRWADTRRETAIAGLKQITGAGANMAGVLLSMVDAKKHSRYGYGDSGYYYGRVKKYYTG